MTDTLQLGWREWLALPSLGLPRIKAKIDSGARTSALHAFYIEPFSRQGQDWVRFGMHPRQRDLSYVVHCEAPITDQRKVTDSGGHSELRYVIQCPIVMGAVTVQAEITLTDRESMTFRMLLGRTAMANIAVIHPGRSYLLGKPRSAH